MEGYGLTQAGQAHSAVNSATDRAILVGVCGGSGSGKTTLAQRLVQALGPEHSVALSFDSYYRDLSHLTVAQRAEVNFDHPDSLDVDLLCGHLGALRDAHEVAVPVYDFATHTRSGDLDLIEPHRFVIVEGILLFAFAEIRNALDVLIFRHCDEPTRAARRLTRDVAERGRSPESVRSQWTSTVQPMHERYVEPFSRYADIVTDQHHDLDDVVATITHSLWLEAEAEASLDPRS